MNNIPLVSIIVPVYNIEKYISKCIESVLSQTFKDWELILVDDGSTDNSGKICDEYALKDNRIKVIHKENEGVTATRDKGVKEAQGEFLFFIDGDDYITDNALELLINKQKENDADLVRGSLCSIKEDGIIKCKYIVTNDIDNINNWYKYINNISGWNIWNNLIRTSIYKNCVRISNEVLIGEDLIASSQLAIQLKSISKCTTITYFYVQRNSSVMHSIEKDQNRTYSLYLLMLKNLDEINSKYKELRLRTLHKILELTIYRILFLNLLNNRLMFKKYKKDVFKLYIKYFVINYNIQKYVLKESWKCYLNNWKSITKFIL